MPEEQVASPDQQMAMLTTLARLKKSIEETVEEYRGFNREELTSGQFAVLILRGVALSLDAD